MQLPLWREKKKQEQVRARGEQEDGGLRNKKSCVYSMGQPREGDFLPEGGDGAEKGDRQ